MVLREIFGVRECSEQGSGGDCLMWGVMICTVSYKMSGNDVGGACGTYVWRGGAWRVWWENVKGSEYFENLSVGACSFYGS